MADTSLSAGVLTTFENPTVLADEVAGWLLRLALEAGDRFAICLSGGSTPKTLYERLAQAPFREEFPWAKTHWFFGDERFVPDGDKDNNFTMASHALLSHVPVPNENVHRIVTEVSSPEQAASAYDAELRRYYGAETIDADRPLFDVNFLGLGPDGHTASLIPGQPVLEERSKWVAAVSQGRPEVRITLTYPPLESSRHIAFLVTGKAKKDMLAHVRSGATDVPAGGLTTKGQVHWFADRDAIDG
ncbi:6-phosphogluconolactonase [Lichenihabitans sp. PAMC28606]|uniref:6-phosphogluconolactonase n=1 Tax=Lichenihabitans sp. PAMC28606 TaxID=2880932 RepID=UPI001D09BC62|nr:6-phosphogluconolactonase [Lichenihabitans sp. PAMC28606]UDL95764.1 6-phosphogluconolactonase [Lichenihabitans sp. PAMC28606]